MGSLSRMHLAHPEPGSSVQIHQGIVLVRPHVARRRFTVRQPQCEAAVMTQQGRTSRHRSCPTKYHGASCRLRGHHR